MVWMYVPPQHHHHQHQPQEWFASISVSVGVLSLPVTFERNDIDRVCDL